MKDGDNEFKWYGDTPGAGVYLFYMRSVPNHPFKLRLARNLARLFFSNGLRLRGLNDAVLLLQFDDYIPNHIILTGAYEPKSLSLALSIMSNGGTFLDIGSNFGLYTCTVGQLRDVKCISIEPAADAFVHLQRNVFHNPKLQVTLAYVGLSSAGRFVRVEVPVSHNSGTARVVLGDSNLQKYYIRCVSLNELLEEIRPESIKLLKIDVEGYEMEVFRGLNWSGPYRPENIIMEFTEYMARNQDTTRDCLEFFDTVGYDAFDIGGLPLNVGNCTRLAESNIWLRSR